jgi:hypothetical protein
MKKISYCSFLAIVLLTSNCNTGPTSNSSSTSGKQRSPELMELEAEMRENLKDISIPKELHGLNLTNKLSQYSDDQLTALRLAYPSYLFSYLIKFCNPETSSPEYIKAVIKCKKRDIMPGPKNYDSFFNAFPTTKEIEILDEFDDPVAKKITRYSKPGTGIDKLRAIGKLIKAINIVYVEKEERFFEQDYSVEQLDALAKIKSGSVMRTILNKLSNGSNDISIETIELLAEIDQHNESYTYNGETTWRTLTQEVISSKPPKLKREQIRTISKYPEAVHLLKLPGYEKLTPEQIELVLENKNSIFIAIDYKDKKELVEKLISDSKIGPEEFRVILDLKRPAFEFLITIKNYEKLEKRFLKIIVDKLNKKIDSVSYKLSGTDADKNNVRNAIERHIDGAIVLTEAAMIANLDILP